MSYLIDTQILIWAESDPGRLPAEIRTILEEKSVAVSAATFWEMAIKVSLGKLRLPRSVKVIADATPFDLLPVRADHAAAVEDLPHHHKDPFDRMLIAQALFERLTLLTADKKLREYGEFVQVVE